MAAKSAILTAFFVTGGIPHSDPQCGLRLVNESNHEHYSHHPYFKDLEYDPLGCEDMAQYRQSEGCDVHNFVIRRFIALVIGTSIFAMIYEFGRPRMNNLGLPGPKSIGQFLLTNFVAQQAAKLMYAQSHFEQDITHMTAALIHHGTGEIHLNRAGSCSGAQQLLFSAAQQLLYTCVLIMLMRRATAPGTKSPVNPFVLVVLFQLWGLRMAYAFTIEHTAMHHLRLEDIPKNPWPYTKMYRAYKHVIVHHDDGHGFLGEVFIDPLYDGLMHAYAWLHNHLLGLRLATAPHFAFATIFDTGLGCMSAVLIWAHFKTAEFFLGEPLGGGASGGSVMGTQRPKKKSGELKVH